MILTYVRNSPLFLEVQLQKLTLGAIFILRKGVLGLFQTTHLPLQGIVSILIYQPQILHKIFENHLPPRKKNQMDIILLEYVSVQCSHL